jgi:formyl-CoA transferase
MRVVDLTQVLAGPYFTQILGDFGADVIKVEIPHGGDQSRTTMGPKLKGPDRAGFLAVNRNKRSLTIDLKTDAGRAILLRLLDRADVLVENFRPGVADRLGIGYDAVHELNPHLIYASLSGFGSTGPEARRPGYDLIAQAMTGVMSVTGEPGGPPVKCGIPICDLATGLFAVIGILTAHAARVKTGLGQHVETSLYDAGVGLSIWEATQYWSSGAIPGPLGSGHRLTAPYQALRTADGYLAVAGNNQRSWESLCRTLDRADLVGDPRFSTNDARMDNLAALVTELESALGARTTAEWQDLLVDAGVACAPIRTYDAVLNDPHTRARGLVIDLDHEVEGPMHALATPVTLPDTPARVRTAAPLLSADTDDVLSWLGYTAADIGRFHGEAIV